MRALLRSVALGLACAAVVPLDALLGDPHALLRAMPRAGWTDGLQRAFWLPWQIGDNLRHGRPPWDASVFVGSQGATLADLAGNPGAAVLGAPLHTVLVPPAAHAAWLVILVASGAAAGAALGGRLGGGGTRAGLLGAALVAGCATWTMDLADGAIAAGWVAPALAVVWAGVAARPWTMALAGVVGALTAPVPTLAAAAMSRALPMDRPSGRGFRMDALAVGIGGLACAARLGWPPLGAAVDSATTGLRACVPLGVADHTLPLPAWSLPGLVGLATLGGRARLVACVAAATATLALLWKDGSWQREALAAVLVVAAAGVLRHMAARSAAAGLVAILVLAEPTMLRLRGAPARPWTGPAWEVPDALVGWARTPRAHVILHAPVHEVREGAVGLVPFHQQRIVGGPGLHRDGPARRAMQAWMRDLEAVRTVARAGEAPLTRATPSPAFQLARLGVDRVVALGGDPVLHTGLTRVLGPSTDGVWTLVAPGRGEHRPPPGPDAPQPPPSTPGKR